MTLTTYYFLSFPSSLILMKSTEMQAHLFRSFLNLFLEFLLLPQFPLIRLHVCQLLTQFLLIAEVHVQFHFERFLRLIKVFRHTFEFLLSFDTCGRCNIKIEME